MEETTRALALNGIVMQGLKVNSNHVCMHHDIPELGIYQVTVRRPNDYEPPKNAAGMAMDPFVQDVPAGATRTCQLTLISPSDRRPERWVEYGSLREQQQCPRREHGPGIAQSLHLVFSMLVAVLGSSWRMGGPHCGHTQGGSSTLNGAPAGEHGAFAAYPSPTLDTAHIICSVWVRCILLW